MNTFSTIGVITVIIGTISGISGLILGILNFIRDRPKIQIILNWDMQPFGEAEKIYDKNKLWGVVIITNIGRRPIFVSHARLKIPGGKEELLIMESINGEKLQEGDAPKRYMVTQEGLEAYADKWDRIRAVIIDSTGKTYYSKPIKKCPSWAKK